MSTFKTTLTQALEASDEVIVDGYELEYCDLSDPIRLTISNEDELYCIDQEIEVGADGSIIMDVEGGQHNFMFMVSRTLEEGDL